MKKKLLVTGASGFIGWNICRSENSDWNMHGLFHQHPIAIPGADTHSVNIADLQEIEKAFAAIKPDAVIHLAAISSPNVCQEQKQSSWQVNVTASKKIAALCARDHIPCVFASSSQVFDGRHAPYSETSPVGPVNAYGYQKLEAEKQMRQAYENVTVCRIPLSFGLAPDTSSSFLQPMLAAFNTGKQQRLFHDEYRCVLGAQSAVQGFLLALEHPGELFLMAGDESISRYEFGKKVAEIFAFDPETLIACGQADIQMSAQRPADLSIDNSKIKSQGFSPLSVEDELLYVREHNIS